MNAVTGKESYLYDGNGRRARTLNSTTGTIEYFGYGADGRLLQDWSNRRNVRNGYVYLGNTLVGLYEVNITNGATAPRYKHTDALGSPVVTTDAGRNTLSRQGYTPYGIPMTPQDGVGYTGHFVDVGTGLTYMQQRYYDPAIGRFLSVDPAGAGFNQYNYANNNPYAYIDPDGRWAGHLCDIGGCESGSYSDGAGDMPPARIGKLGARNSGVFQTIRVAVGRFKALRKNPKIVRLGVWNSIEATARAHPSAFLVFYDPTRTKNKPDYSDDLAHADITNYTGIYVHVVGSIRDAAETIFHETAHLDPVLARAWNVTNDAVERGYDPFTGTSSFQNWESGDQVRSAVHSEIFQKVREAMEVYDENYDD